MNFLCGAAAPHFFGGVKMSEEWQARQELLTGEEKLCKLAKSRVAVIGLGGVGGAVVEGLARAGVGVLLLVDHDTVSDSNRNRQLIATVDTVGMEKTEAWRRRVLCINPAAQVQLSPVFVGPQQSGGIFDFAPDYVVDAIDTVSAKLWLMEQCKAHNVPLISCMGTGNRLSAEGFAIDDIEKTAGSGCPLARVLRREARRRGISGVTVLYNKLPPAAAASVSAFGRNAPGSISYVPPVAGFLAAGHVVRSLME